MVNTKTYKRMVPDDIVPQYLYILPTNNSKIVNLVASSCIKTYNIQTMQTILTTWLNINAQIENVDQFNDLIAVTTNKKYIALIRYEQQQCQTIILDNIPSSIKISQDGSLVFVGCINGYAYIIDSETGEILKQFERIKTQIEQKQLKILQFTQVIQQQTTYYIIAQQSGIIYLFDKNFNRIDTKLLENQINQFQVKNQLILFTTVKKQMFQLEIVDNKIQICQQLDNLLIKWFTIYNSESGAGANGNFTSNQQQVTLSDKQRKLQQQIYVCVQTQSFTDFYSFTGVSGASSGGGSAHNGNNNMQGDNNNNLQGTSVNNVDIDANSNTQEDKTAKKSKNTKSNLKYIERRPETTIKEIFTINNKGLFLNKDLSFQLINDLNQYPTGSDQSDNSDKDNNNMIITVQGANNNILASPITTQQQPLIAHPVDENIIYYKLNRIFQVNSRTLQITNQTEIEGKIIYLMNLPGKLYTMIFTQDGIVFVLNRQTFVIQQAIKILSTEIRDVLKYKNQILLGSENNIYFSSLQFQNGEFQIQIVKKITTVQPIQKLATNDIQIAYSTNQNVIFLLNCDTGKQVKIFDFSLQIFDFKFISDSKILVSSADKTLRVFGCQFGELQGIVKLQHAIRHLSQFQGTSLFLCSDNQNCSVFDCQGLPVKIYTMGVRGSNDGGYGGYSQQTTKLTYLNHQDSITDIEVGSTCRYAVTVGYDGLIQWIVDEEDVLVGPEEDNDNLGLQEEDIQKIDIYDKIEGIINQDDINQVIQMIKNTDKQKLAMCIRQMRNDVVTKFNNQLQRILANQGKYQNSILNTDAIYAQIRLIKNQYVKTETCQNMEDITDSIKEQLLSSIGEIDALEFIRQQQEQQ